MVLLFCPHANAAKQEPAEKDPVARWFPGVTTEEKPRTFRSLAGALDRSAARAVRCPENWRKKFSEQVLVCAQVTDTDATKQAFVDAFKWLGDPGLLWSMGSGQIKQRKFLDWSDYTGITWASITMVQEEATTPVLYLQDDGLLFVTLKLQ